MTTVPSAHHPAAPAASESNGLVSRARLAAFLVLFVALTAAGVYWASPGAAAVQASWSAFAALPRYVHVVVLAMTVSLVGAQMLRIFVFGRAIGVHVGLRAAFDTTIADSFFSWVSPTAALGDTATIFMLSRYGVPVDAGALMAFGELATGFALIMGLAGALVALGFGPPVSVWVGGAFVTACCVAASMCCVLITGAFFPTASERAIDAVSRPFTRQRWVVWLASHAKSAVARLAKFRRGGAPGSLAMLGAHVVYYSNFIGVLVVLATAFGADWRDVVPVAIVYQAFLYVAPTPGASGLGEASAELFFGRLLPGGKAFAVVMLYRLLTFYMPVLFGLIYLPAIGAMSKRGAARK